MKIPEGYKLPEFDLGLLNDYGGGKVEWWLDYIRYLLGNAHLHYQEQFEQLSTPPAQEVDEDTAIKAAWYVLKPQLDPSNWTVSESATFYGFFGWGWEARRQYGVAPAQEVEPVAEVPDE